LATGAGALAGAAVLTVAAALGAGVVCPERIRAGKSINRVRIVVDYTALLITPPWFGHFY
jgi:hypothetical protein